MKDIKQTISHYQKTGIEIQQQEDVVIIRQKRLINGYILNQKQLYQRAREIFPNPKIKIKPVVFSLDVNSINEDWINQKMQEFGIKIGDLVKQTTLDNSSLSLFLSGKRKMNKSVKALFYYYFLTYELNRDFRDYLKS